MNPHIKVWRFHDAPDEFKRLSTYGGDEDWLAHIPVEYANEYINWLEYGSFGCCEISEHKLEDGSVIKIGAHG
jgi:hypothetical protein